MAGNAFRADLSQIGLAGCCDTRRSLKACKKKSSLFVRSSWPLRGPAQAACGIGREIPKSDVSESNPIVCQKQTAQLLGSEQEALQSATTAFLTSRPTFVDVILSHTGISCTGFCIGFHFTQHSVASARKRRWLAILAALWLIWVSLGVDRTGDHSVGSPPEPKV